jgi:alkylated DNA nucleotide flippase Atl1
MARRMSRPERAMQVWQILIAAAHERRTLTYGEVAALLGFEGAGVLAQILRDVLQEPWTTATHRSCRE